MDRYDAIALVGGLVALVVAYLLVRPQGGWR